MKAIINGLRYDTDKAELIGEYENGYDRGNFSWWLAGLYRTPRAKRWFLAGTGGPMSRYSRSQGPGQWSGGSKITPLEEAEAREWAMEYLEPHLVEVAFGASIEDA